ncbi:putative disrupter of telomere silencing protein Dot5 [Aspergillus campestris IBT 28561]|uniref:thioredoxin-dependent peroxiredoxin n=1 Tax=Aspergillus campestris (strain IBT 28561) TaxID=1392248 RepID=A0A2I1CW58_ASPC2|nr:putative disrupter of telomere silencing protein Dot5 [Aspergillus campestris IBT 28561]PKY01848.1 putative disrupter of telomere silencing protein Dot5 [Aspergillus campestris IBT 28561]
MVELRKRKAPAVTPAPIKKSKKSEQPTTSPKQPTGKAETASSTVSRTIPKVGDVIVADGFGGEIETNEGAKTTLKSLVDMSKSGVVIFTYPRASTPGCTKQVCMFRDDYQNLVSAGLSVYGLSADSPKANTTFKTKQKLPYTLLCDGDSTLISALGFKKHPKGTTRGVFAVGKGGDVLLLEAGGPAATLEAVLQLVPTMSNSG